MGRLTKEGVGRRNALAELGLKHCARCKENKPLDQFHKDAKEKDGLAGRCKQCRSKGGKEYYQDNREKRLAHSKNFREANPDHNRQWREKNADYVKSDWRRRTYLLTPEQYDQMLKDQNYVCAICGGVNETGKALSVDHDHSCCAGVKSCGKCIRQLLCNGCNVGLGYFKDDPALLKVAAKYIESHSQEQL